MQYSMRSVDITSSLKANENAYVTQPTESTIDQPVEMTEAKPTVTMNTVTVEEGDSDFVSRLQRTESIEPRLHVLKYGVPKQRMSEV